MAYIFEVNGCRNVRIIDNGRNIFDNDLDALAVHAVTITFVAHSITERVYSSGWGYGGGYGGGGYGGGGNYHYETTTYLSWSSTAPLYWDIPCIFAGHPFTLKAGTRYGETPTTTKWGVIATNACKKITLNGNSTTKVLSYSIARQNATYNIIETRLCIE